EAPAAAAPPKPEAPAAPPQPEVKAAAEAPPKQAAAEPPRPAVEAPAAPAAPADQAAAKGGTWKSAAMDALGHVAKAIGQGITDAMKSFNTQVKRGTIVNRASGKELKVGGYQPDRKDPKAPEPKKFGSKKLKASDLPPSADLRQYMTPVEDQGELSSCVGNATVGAYEYLINRLVGQPLDVSRLFVYYNARALDGETNKDNGTTITNAVKVLSEKGACFENTWPYEPKSVNNEPSQPAYQEAVYLILKDAARVDLDKDAVRTCLAEGFPICFGIEIFDSFQKVGSHGRVQIPDPSSEQSLGGHAMLCVGYSDPDQVFIVRNSWSAEWGDKGYCYIPYDYFLNPDYNGDCWSILAIDKGPAFPPSPSPSPSNVVVDPSRPPVAPSTTIV